jgi:hypothetical protein
MLIRRNVRFGSKADICGATSHVRFTPSSDRESGFPHKVMSALPPKADMCSALAHVCFGPIADIHQSTDRRLFCTSSIEAVDEAALLKFINERWISDVGFLQ